VDERTRARDDAAAARRRSKEQQLPPRALSRVRGSGLSLGLIMVLLLLPVLPHPPSNNFDLQPALFNLHYLNMREREREREARSSSMCDCIVIIHQPHEHHEYNQRNEKISNNSSFGIIDIAESSTSDRIIVIVDTACLIDDGAYRWRSGRQTNLVSASH